MKKIGLFQLTMLAWLSMLGTDLLLHAGILAHIYARPSPFLLEPTRAFQLIPLGYLSFLLLALLLAQLAIRLDVHTWLGGVRLGLWLGAAAWGALVLGLASISTAPPDLLVGWFIGQTVELAIAGGIAGAALAGARRRRLWILVGGWILLAFAITVVLQNVGLAPSSVLSGSAG